MSRVAAGLLAVVAASFAVGCGEGGPRSGGAPTKPPPQVAFVTADLSTGVRVASVQISDSGIDVSPELVNTLAAAVRVSTWPGDVEVASTKTITNFPGQLPGGAQRLAYAQIDWQLDAGLDGNAWYAISLPARPADYTLGNAFAFRFEGGARGSRLSPSHPPVVGSVMSCTKESGVVAAYARFSEAVSKAAGAPALDYGLAATPCAVGGDSPGETQFICADAISGQPFSLQIPEGVSAQASGSPMAPGTLDSAGMQADVAPDGCSVHKPVIVD